jgi:rhamnogalacturonan endolyase
MIRRWILGAGFCGLAAVRCVAAEGERAILLDDDYRAMRPGMISSGVIGAHSEYHYLPQTAPVGNWVVSAFRTNPSQRAWRLIEENGERMIWQSYTETDRERAYTHPMLIAGVDLWGDYTVETRFAPESDAFQSGVVFRYRNDRHYYFAGVVGQKAILKKVNGGVGFRKMDETVLAESAFEWKPGEFIPLKVTAEGDRLTVEFDGRVKLEARDATFRQGKIGYTSDIPTKFASVRVTCAPEVKVSIDQARAKREAEEARLQAENPPMVLWKKFSTGGFGSGRNLRFGDLDGDGQIDILVVQQKPHGPGDGYSEVGCMTAMTVDGKRLWQVGLADPWNDHLTNDVGAQIHDIDGDGKNEVIYCREMEIVVADGATGRTKYKAPTPEAPLTEGQTARFPRILGDALYFCDFRGLGSARDLVIKNRYRKIWVYNDKLEPMWSLPLQNTGHFPYAYDVDGDGKDELGIGYALVNHNGEKIWTHEGTLQDHADGVAIVPLKDGEEPRWLCVGSDEGLVIGDMKGNILHHHHVGHTQNLTVADLRSDLPGLEMATINFWGNQGIVNFFDADGNRYHDCEPSQHGSMMAPLNWKGDGQEYWVLSPNSEEGGAYDGWGRRVLRFPADGHPDLCVAVLDLTGDSRDEIVVWDPWEVWIYTQSDSPKAGRLYKPKRNPLSNDSNYRASVSQPGWSE